MTFSQAGALAAIATLTASLAVQTIPKEEELKRYRRELAPGLPVAKRLTAIQNVAYFDSLPMAKLLVDSLTATLKKIEELDAERAEIDTQLERLLKAQIEKGGKNGTPDYAGVDFLQAKQKRIGGEIGVEEEVVRAYVAGLGSLKHAESLDLLLAQHPKKPARLRTTLIQSLGGIDNGRVAEYLIGLLGDSVFELRVTAAAALLKQKPEFVPSSALAPLLRSSEWQERSLGIDALARIGDRTALELLVNQTPKETGKCLADLCGRLEQLTGQKLGKTPPAWVAWWQKARDSYEARGIDIRQSAQILKEEGKYATFFHVKFDSLKVVYVIDISGSMTAAVDDYQNEHPAPGKSRIDLARREVKASISALPPEASFNVIAYSDVVIPWNDRNIPATADNKKKIFEWLDGLAAVGQTNIFDALEKTFELAPQSTKDKYYATTGDTILFMSDGGPTCGRTTDCAEILREVARWNETRRITIHTVGIGAQTVELFLTDLAKQNGGQSTFVRK